jgi:hypothetical protein
MADLFDFNYGVTTHPGARAIVHPGADSDEHMVRYRVVAETDEHITLDDGYAYDKRTGEVRRPAGRPTLQNRLAVTEGSAMFDSWSRTAEVPHRQRPRSRPNHGRAHHSGRALTAALRFLRHR